ncbi:unnamed protein product, partial [Leptosia nina]
MEVYYQNVNRIRSKTTDLFLNVLNSSYDLICLTETNLTQGVFNSEVFDNRYLVYRKDRYSSCSSKRDGGGVLIAVKNNIHAIRLEHYESVYEDLWISVNLNNSSLNGLLICVCYLPPDLTKEDLNSYYSHLQDFVLHKANNRHVLILGDFNTHNLSWLEVNPNSYQPIDPSDTKARLLSESVYLCNLYQFNHIANINNRLLDLVFSSFDAIEVVAAEPLSRIDLHHPPLLIQLKLKSDARSNLMRNTTAHFNFLKSNYSCIKSSLAAIDWFTVLGNFENIDL